MKEFTKVSLAAIGTSLLTIALAAGAIVVFHSQIKDKAEILFGQHNRSVSGRDTPVGVRGGSMTVRARDSQWSGTGTANNYQTTLSSASDRRIQIQSQDLDDWLSDPLVGVNWAITITNRVPAGTTDDGKGGYQLCSQPDCNIKQAAPPPTNTIYLVPISATNDTLAAPDIDDDETFNPAAFHKAQYVSKDASCGKCQYISHIKVEYSGVSHKESCLNSACEVTIVNKP